MFGFTKAPSPAPAAKTPETVKQTPARKIASEPVTPTKKKNYFDDDDDDDWGRPASSYKKNAGKNSAGPQDFDSMSVQELEGYAVNKAEDTTNSVNNCLKIAEDIRGDASRTLETLHQQGEQIHRTHEMAADIEKDLNKGEKLLNNLGGMFSMPWKNKKNRDIKGPTALPSKDNKKPASKAEREKLGLGVKRKGAASAPVTPPSEPENAMQKIEMEKAKQDDALSDLSNILGDLKGMATDMGTELNRQNKAMDHLSDDVDELNSRVKGANRRASHLLKK